MQTSQIGSLLLAVLTCLTTTNPYPLRRICRSASLRVPLGMPFERKPFERICNPLARSGGFQSARLNIRIAVRADLQSARLNIRIFNPHLSHEYQDSESSPLQGIGGRATTLSPLLSLEKRLSIFCKFKYLCYLCNKVF